MLDANVVDGLFSTQLDFGVDAFAGSSRWIEIAVRSPAGSGGYTTLDPRQRLTAAPVAWYAMRPWIPLNGNFYLPLPAEGNGVGIGLSAPVTRLHVRAPAFFPAETMRIDDFFGRSQLRIAMPESAGKVGLQAWNGQTNTAGTLAFNLGGALECARWPCTAARDQARRASLRGAAKRGIAAGRGLIAEPLTPTLSPSTGRGGRVGSRWIDWWRGIMGGRWPMLV